MPTSKPLGVQAIFVLGIVVATSAWTTRTAAQTRLMLEAGQLQPLSNLADAIEPSLVFAGRVEFQEVNPLGKVRLISLFGRLGYAPLDLDGDLEASLEARGESTEASYFTVSGGIRVYSEHTPLFVSAGLGYANYDPPGNTGGRHGFEMGLGGGLGVKILGIIVEGEVRGHMTMLEKVDDIEFLTVTGAAGFRF